MYDPRRSHPVSVTSFCSAMYDPWLSLDLWYNRWPSSSTTICQQFQLECVCVCVSLFFTHTAKSSFELSICSACQTWKQEENNIRAKDKKPLTSATAYYSYLGRRASYSRAEVFLNQKFTWLQQQFLLNTIFQSRSFLGCNSSCFQTSYSKAEVFLVVATIASMDHIPSRYYLGSNNKLLPTIIEFLCCNHNPKQKFSLLQ